MPSATLEQARARLRLDHHELTGDGLDALVTARIEASIEHAVHAGSLTRRRLVGAADEVLAAHELAICPAS